MRRLWRMQRGAFEDTAKTAGWQARGFYCRDGVKAPTRRRGRSCRNGLLSAGSCDIFNSALHNGRRLATPPERGCCLCVSHYISDGLP